MIKLRFLNAYMIIFLSLWNICVSFFLSLEWYIQDILTGYSLS